MRPECVDASIAPCTRCTPCTSRPEDGKTMRWNSVGKNESDQSRASRPSTVLVPDVHRGHREHCVVAVRPDTPVRKVDWAAEGSAVAGSALVGVGGVGWR